jgi:hypothetical protein
MRPTWTVGIRTNSLSGWQATVTTGRYWQDFNNFRP